MSEYKNFRITLQLSHFFQDRRSMCKIFVNKRMKYISDLQNHIQNIFGLKNFYFISDGHFIPPSEDIRILKPDDTVIALPSHHTNSQICTSTPLVTDITSPVKGKRKRHAEKEDIDFHYSPEKVAEVIIKKKKKSKPKYKLPNDEDLQQLNNQDKLDGACSGNTQDDITDTISCLNSGNTNEEISKRKKSKTKREIPLDEDLQQLNNKDEPNTSFKTRPNDTAKHKKEMKPHNIFSKLESDTPEDGSKNKLTSSVKKKVQYFENNVNLKTTNSVAEGENECKNDLNVGETLNDEELSQDLSNATDYFKEKKLFIQKRNNNIISYDLPKRSNVVKSILISNNLDDQTASTSEPLAKDKSTSHVNDNSITCTSSQKLVPEKPKRLFTPLRKNSLIIPESGDLEIRLNERFSNQSLNFIQDVSRENLINTINVMENRILKPAEKVSDTFLRRYNKLHIEKENDTDNAKDFPISEKHSISGNCSTENVIRTLDIEQQSADTTIKELMGDINLTVDTVETTNNISYNEAASLARSFESEDLMQSAEHNAKHTDNDSAISIGNNVCTFIPTTDDADVYSKAEKVILNDIVGISAEPSENSFVTKRKRKRSRKRKTKSGSPNIMLPAKPIMYDTKISLLSTSPSVHIKFNDEGEAFPVENVKPSNKCLESIIIEPSTNIVHSESSKEVGLKTCKNEDTMIGKIFDSQDDCVSILNNTECELSRTTKCSTPNNTDLRTSFVIPAKAKCDTDTFKVEIGNSNNNLGKALEKTETFPEEQEVTNQVDITILDDAEVTNDELSSDGTCLISEDTVSKSPLMVSTKPKNRDIIAFKILRLTESYTPEISRYIIGEVISVNDDGSNVDIKIIDGFDQYIQPDGKFSLASEGETVSTIKSYSWSDLIEPRLIFP